MRSARTRTPKQGRSRKTRESLVRAAMQLFERKGYHNTTSREIADLAGTSVGSFYVYFEDKRDVLLELVETLKEDGLRHMRESFSNTTSSASTTEDRICLLLSSLSTLKSLNPYLWAQAKLLAYSDREIAQVLNTFFQELSREVATLIDQWETHPGITDPEVAATVVLQASGLADYVIGAFDEVITTQVRDCLRRYLSP